MSSTKNVVRVGLSLVKLSGSANDQCAMCSSSRRQSYFIHACAAAHLQKLVFTRGSLSPSDWGGGGGGGGGLSDGMKKYRRFILSDNGLLVNCLKVR